MKKAPTKYYLIPWLLTCPVCYAIALTEQKDCKYCLNSTLEAMPLTEILSIEFYTKALRKYICK